MGKVEASIKIDHNDVFILCHALEAYESEASGINASGAWLARIDTLKRQLYTLQFEALDDEAKRGSRDYSEGYAVGRHDGIVHYPKWTDYCCEIYRGIADIWKIGYAHGYAEAQNELEREEIANE